MRVTHLSTAVVAASRTGADRHRRPVAAAAACPRNRPPSAWAPAPSKTTSAATAGLAEAGVETAIVALPDVATPGALETFGP